MITIGSDPEFIILDKHKELVPASEFFSRDTCNDCSPCDDCGIEKCVVKKCTKKECWDCDRCQSEVRECDYCNDCEQKINLCDTEIGTDACDEVGELRPHYADNPIEHHNNIQHLIEQIDTDGGYILRGGTFVEDQSIGGHIHIGGFPNPLLKYPDEGDGKYFKDMNYLSNYLSLYAGIPLRRIEHPRDLEYRGMYEDDYGFFGDMHNTDYGVEWRMPSSWLVDSEIALSALSIAYVVANEYKIHPEAIHIHLDDDNFMQKLLQKKSVFSVIKKVEGMQLYRTYSHEIEPLFQLINGGKKWKDKHNFKDFW